MKILFLLTQDLESPSGLGRYFPLAKALVQRGHQVTIAALHSDIAALEKRRFVQEGVQVWYVGQMHVQKRANRKTYFPVYKLLLLALWATMRLSWAALTTPADVIHIGKPHPMNSLAGLLGKLRGIPLVLDCDDDETAGAHYTGKWQRAGIAFFERRAPQWVKAITTNTYASRERLEKMGVEAGKITYLSNGIDRDRFRPPELQALAQLQARWELQDRPVVGYIGSLSRPSHPVELLFQAFAQVHQVLPEAVLLLVGGGEDLESLYSFAEELNLSEAVRFTGRVPANEAPGYYTLADVSVDPVYDNAVARGRSPLKLFESWACGTPFVSCDVGERRRLLGEPSAGLLARPADPEDLARAILQVLQDGDLARSLVEHGSERVGDYYWDQLAPRAEQVYQWVRRQA